MDAPHCAAHGHGTARRRLRRGRGFSRAGGSSTPPSPHSGSHSRHQLARARPPAQQSEFARPPGGLGIEIGNSDGGSTNSHTQCTRAQESPRRVDNGTGASGGSSITSTGPTPSAAIWTSTSARASAAAPPPPASAMAR